jgi:hypothetical protein
MTGWDGTGVDPFLPERLASEITITRAERRLYQEWWASFSAWLVTVHRSVLGSNVRPDASAVWAHAPLWAEHMTTFVQGPVKATMGLAYERLFGRGYQFDARPAVSSYLGSVHNRMVRTSEEVYDLVASTVARGAAVGDAIPDIAARVDEILTATGTERWESRAVTVARTETIGALNRGRADGFQAIAEATGEELETIWLSTIDARTRSSHAEADQQRVPLGTPFTVGGAQLDHPGDPFGPPEEVINCVIGDTRVEYPGLRAVTRRWFEGDVVVLSFASGDQLTVTPNHPILRADGRWTPAGLLDKGDHCVRGVGLDRPLGTPHEDGGPAQVSEVYRAAEQLGHPERVAVAPPDFHGDGWYGEVKVVPVQGELSGHRQAATDEEVEQFGLALADLARTGVGGGERSCLPVSGSGGHCCDDVSGAAVGVRGGSKVATLLVSQGRHADQVRLGAGARRNAHRLQSSHDGRPTDAEITGHGEDALTPVVAGAQVGLIDRHGSSEEGCLTGRAQAHASLAEGSVDGGDGDAECGSQFGRGLPPLVPANQRGDVNGEAVPRSRGLASRADGHARQPQGLDDRRVGDAESGGDGRGGFPRFVSTTEVVEVERVAAFAGHVYNLDSGDGWYTANSIVCRNCRCTTLLVESGENVDMTGRGFSDWDEWNDE